MKDLLRIADLSPAGPPPPAGRRRHVPRARRTRRRGLPAGDTVITYFAKPSTRTRLSFGTAISRLGGVPEVVRPDELQLGRGETIEDTARVVSRYARAFVIRTFADEDVRRFAAAASIPVVNALTDGHHPCQAPRRPHDAPGPLRRARGGADGPRKIVAERVEARMDLGQLLADAIVRTHGDNAAKWIKPDVDGGLTLDGKFDLGRSPRLF